MVLFVNCCPRDNSRTKYLASQLLNQLGNYQEVNLYKEGLQPLTNEKLELRTTLINNKDYSHPMFDYAKQFTCADTIVIAVSFWDISFPSLLKTYIENIYVTGIVSKYSETGMPIGLCKAKKLYYVTTFGGPLDDCFGYRYIQALSKDYFGIQETELIKAEMLDVYGSDVDSIIQETISNIKI